jgi:hypothetical protein
MKFHIVPSTGSVTLRVLVVVVVALTYACAATDRPFTPSPLITPDVIAIRTGQTQVFTVSNSAVVAFTLRSDAGDWKEFVAIDASYGTAQGIRLIALKPTAGGYVYLSANLGDGRSRLIAVLSIQ